MRSDKQKAGTFAPESVPYVTMTSQGRHGDVTLPSKNSNRKLSVVFRLSLTESA